MVQTDFGEPPIFFPGQISRSYVGQLIDTKTNAQAGQPRIDHIVFAGAWAAADTQTTTIGGTAVVATMQAGEDTIPEAAARALAALTASAAASELATFALGTTNTENDTVIVTSRESHPGSGVYHNAPVTSAEATDGNGTATASSIQGRINRGDMRFGVGVALDTTDPRGKRIVLPPTTGFRFGGVIVHSHAVDNRRLLNDAGFPVNSAIGCMLKGYVAVRVDADVLAALTPGMPAYLKHTQDGNGPAGQWRHSGTNADAIADATFTGRRQTGSNPLAELLLA